MDQTDSDFHLFCVPVCRNAADCVEHCPGWIREEESADSNWKSFCFLCPSDLVFPSHRAFKALQQARTTKAHRAVSSMKLKSIR